MGLRSLARTVAANKSYRQSGTTDMFGYFFQKEWRDKGHPASGVDRPTKKPRRGGKVNQRAARFLPGAALHERR